MFNYSKFIYDRLKSAPSQTPSQAVSGNISTLQSTAQQTVETKRQQLEKIKKSKNELFDFWMDNGGRFDKKEDNFIYETLQFDNKTIAREAFVLFSLIKKYWGDAKAKDVYRKSLNGDNFNLKIVRFFFVSTNNKYIKKVFGGNTEGERAKMELGFYWKGDGWYVWNNRTGSKDIPIGEYLHLNLGKLKNGLKNPSVEYLVDGTRRGEVSSFVENETNKIKLNSKEMSKKVISWAKGKASNQWKDLPDEMHGYMRRMYGERTGYYVYRYNSVKNRIYALRIKGAPLASTDGTAAYIDIKNGELGGWNGYRDGEKFIKSDILKNMDPVDVEKELVDYKGKEKPGTLTKEQKLFRTKGMISKLSGVSKSFSYSNIDKDYYGVIEKKLIAKLTVTVGATQAKEFAAIRISELKKSVDAFIDSKLDSLKKAITENPKVRFEISVDSEDKIEVKFARNSDRIRYSKLAKEAKEKSKGANLDKLIDQKHEAIMKKLGPLGMFLKFFGVDLKKDVSEYYKSGKKSTALWLVMSITSVEIGRRVLRGKGISSIKDLEKLAKKNKGVLEKDQPIKKDKFKFAGYKITIPKGKGIRPSETFTANGKTVSPEKEKKAKKPKFSFLGLFGGSKKSSDKFVMKDQEIIITQNDTIPKGTIIPKGAKIEKA